MESSGNSTALPYVREQEFECAICQECYTQPCHIQPCQHIYCYECLKALRLSSEPRCPLCRTYIKGLCPAIHIEKQMSETTIICSHCNQLVIANWMNRHKSLCPAAKQVQESITVSSQMYAAHNRTSQVPNRSTFKCPYCQVSNLLRSQLIDHCNSYHINDLQNVVCPICASMPWGDKNLKSSNFLRHLSARHQFDYDTYVDFEEEDDEMLHQALLASLHDQ